MKDMREKLDKYKGRATITAARDGRIEEVICRGVNKVSKPRFSKFDFLCSGNPTKCHHFG